MRRGRCEENCSWNLDRRASGRVTTPSCQVTSNTEPQVGHTASRGLRYYARMNPRKLAGLVLKPGKIEFKLVAPM
jgi:hypothetical protein